jgi:hypothetical protein
MGVARSRLGICTEIQLETLKRKHLFAGLHVNGRMILKWELGLCVFKLDSQSTQYGHIKGLGNAVMNAQVS